jgi:hypothetical protein
MLFIIIYIILSELSCVKNNAIYYISVDFMRTFIIIVKNRPYGVLSIKCKKMVF